MAFDFKKEYREFYLPKDRPEIVAVPVMHYMAVRGQGDPNQPEGAYQQAIQMLYTVACTADKAAFRWVSVIRLPDFVTEEELCWAKQAAWEKKKLDCGAVEFLTVEEGLCVQCMHLGPFDTEAETVARMDSFLAEKGYVNDLSETRMHHEIYLSDARRVIPEKWKTVIRHPIRRG